MGDKDGVMKLLTVVCGLLISSVVACGANVGIGVFPQVVTGNGWTTTFIFSNTSPSTSSVITMDFFDMAGHPMPVSFRDPLNSLPTLQQPQITIRVGAKQTYTFDTISYLAGIQQGYALVTTPTGPIVVNAKCVVAYRSGASISESVTSALPFTMNNYGIALNNTNGFSTGVAWVNFDTQKPLVMRIVARDEYGTLIVDEIVTLCEGCQVSFSTPTRFPQTAGKRGILECFLLTSLASSNSHAAVAFRFNPAGSFTTMDTFPVTE